MAMQNRESCENCDCAIGRLESPQIYNDHIVCIDCLNKLRSAGSAGDATTQKRKIIDPAGILIAVVVVVAVVVVAMLSNGNRQDGSEAAIAVLQIASPIIGLVVWCLLFKFFVTWGTSIALDTYEKRKYRKQ